MFLLGVLCLLPVPYGLLYPWALDHAWTTLNNITYPINLYFQIYSILVPNFLNVYINLLTLILFQKIINIASSMCTKQPMYEYKYELETNQVREEHWA